MAIIEFGTMRIVRRQTVIPSTMMRFCTVAVALALGVLPLGGCQGDGGAVSARWRIVDLASGAGFDPRGSVAANDGSCCLDQAAHACTAANAWIVRDVAITLRDPSTGEAIDVTAEVKPKQCRTRETTTDFVLPVGTFAIGLQANVFDGAGHPAPVQIPPPEVRTIVRGEVVNLQIIEIGVNPLPLPTPTTGVTF
jgi:hypothetical protein